jgi:hypothetical protein
MMARKKITTVQEALALVKSTRKKGSFTKFDGYLLKFVPEALKTPEVCRAAVYNGGAALEYVPEALKTAEMCLEAVSLELKNGPFFSFEYGGHLLRFVPEALKTPELCRAAVENEGSALEYVPESLKDEELCRTAVQCGHQLFMGSDWEGYGSALKFVPPTLRTGELCHDAVINYGSFADAPDTVKTAGFCLAVLAKRWDKETVNAVPDALKTAVFYLEAVKQQPRVFKYVPDALKTSEMCRAAVEKDGGNTASFLWEPRAMLQYVPARLKTPELCLLAVKQNWQSLRFVPAALKTGEMCRIAVLANGDALKYVPRSLIASLAITVSISGQEGDYLLLVDEETGRSKKIHQSLIGDNELTIENGTVKISPSLYNGWFKGK